MFKSPFSYGTKAGVMSIITLVLAAIPIIVVLMYYPQIGDAVPMRFDAAGAVTRWGNRYEVLIAPGLGLALGIATLLSAYKQASRYADEPAMAKMTFMRYARSGVVSGVIFTVASFYILYTALTGHGLSLF